MNNLEILETISLQEAALTLADAGQIFQAILALSDSELQKNCLTVERAVYRVVRENLHHQKEHGRASLDALGRVQPILSQLKKIRGKQAEPPQYLVERLHHGAWLPAASATYLARGRMFYAVLRGAVRVLQKFQHSSDLRRTGAQYSRGNASLAGFTNKKARSKGETS